MSKSKLPQEVGNGDWEALRNLAHKLEPLFDLEGEWTTAEAPASGI